MNFKRQLARKTEKAHKREEARKRAALRKKTGVLVHGAMKYKCLDCGREWWMFLERGLEDPNPNLPHKPVPATIRCEKCGGRAGDVSGYMSIAEEIRKSSGKQVSRCYVPLPDGESYFANRDESDCGVAILAEKDK